MLAIKTFGSWRHKRWGLICSLVLVQLPWTLPDQWWTSPCPAWESSHLRDTPTAPVWSCLVNAQGVSAAGTGVEANEQKSGTTLKLCLGYKWVRCFCLGRKHRIWEQALIVRSITLSSWFLLEFILRAMCKGHYGQMFQLNLVLLLVFVVFGPLRSHVLSPLADVPCESSQLPFCLSFIFVCVILKLSFPSLFLLFSLPWSLCLPRDLLVPAPHCPSK